MRRLFGFALGWVVRLWVATFRVRWAAGSRALADAPGVFAFWHGRQMALFGARRRHAAVALVSRSRDGELSSGVLASFGVESVRGSSSSGGARGLVAIVRRLGRGPCQALFAVDGPRGPAFRAKPGAARAAELAGVPLLPVGARAAWSFSLARAWDGFSVVLPFSPVALVVGEPVDAALAAQNPELLALAIERAHTEADALLAGGVAS
jgi:lysophospholipid acyltransferase (LPLAT)-like uncharacterized protein